MLNNNADKQSFGEESLRDAELCRRIVQATALTPDEKLIVIMRFGLPGELTIRVIRNLFVAPDYCSWDLSKEAPTSGLRELVGLVRQWHGEFTQEEWAGIGLLALAACDATAELRLQDHSAVHRLVYDSVGEMTGDLRYSAAQHALASFVAHPTRTPFWMVWDEYTRNCTETQRALLWQSAIMNSGMHLKPPTHPDLLERIWKEMTPMEREATNSSWGIPAESRA